MIKVRFHLGRGENYNKWQVTYHQGAKFYYEPSEVKLVLYSCTLHNAKNIAEKIWCGATKSVCSWVECERLEVKNIKFADADKLFSKNPDLYQHIRYNPKFLPYWTNDAGKNLDNKKFDYLISINNKIYTKIG